MNITKNKSKLLALLMVLASLSFVVGFSSCKQASGGPSTYTVTFDSNGGSSVPSQSVSAGGVVTKPTDPTRTYYDFKGWYKDGTSYDFSSKVNSDFTLVATWAKNLFTITFDTKGGSEVTSQKVKKGQTLDKEKLETPVYDGYNFAGWYTDSDCTTPFYLNTTITKDYTLYAKWTTGPVVTFEVGYFDVEVKVSENNGVYTFTAEKSGSWYFDDKEPKSDTTYTFDSTKAAPGAYVLTYEYYDSYTGKDYSFTVLIKVSKEQD